MIVWPVPSSPARYGRPGADPEWYPPAMNARRTGASSAKPRRGRAAGSLLAVALALGPAACVHGGAPSGVPNLYDARRQVEAYIDSGRYAADCAAVAAKAREYLDRRARQVAKPAAVF